MDELLWVTMPERDIVIFACSFLNLLRTIKKVNNARNNYKLRLKLLEKSVSQT